MLSDGSIKHHYESSISLLSDDSIKHHYESTISLLSDDSVEHHYESTIRTRQDQWHKLHPRLHFTSQPSTVWLWQYILTPQHLIYQLNTVSVGTGLCVCVDVFNYLTNSKQTNIWTTGGILLVSTRSKAISRRFRVKIKIRLGYGLL